MKKRIVLLIVLCLLVNGLAGLGAVLAEPGGFLPNCGDIQSPVFNFIGNIGLPCRAVADMVKNGEPLKPEYRHNKDTQGTDSNNTSCVYAVSKSMAKYISKNLSKDNGKLLENFRAQVSNGSPPGEKQNEHYGGFISIFLLMYFVLLSRGNLPAEIAIIRICTPGCA